MGSWSNSLYKLILLLDHGEPHRQLSTFRAAPRKPRGVLSWVSGRRPRRTHFLGARRDLCPGQGITSPKNSGVLGQDPTTFWPKRAPLGLLLDQPGPHRTPPPHGGIVFSHLPQKTLRKQPERVYYGQSPVALRVCEYLGSLTPPKCQFWCFQAAKPQFMNYPENSIECP